MVNSKVSSKKQQSIKNVPEILGFVILASLATQSTMGGYLSYVNVSITAVGDSWGVFSFLSSLSTYIFQGNFSKGIVQITSMLLIISAKVIVRKRLSILINSFLTTLSILFSTIISSFSQRTSFSFLSFQILSAIMCGCLVYITSKILKFHSKTKKISVNGVSGVAVSFIYIILITTLCSINIFSLNLGRVIGIITILFAVGKYGIFVGEILGAITTFSVIMYSPLLGKNMLFLCACISFSYLASKLGKLGITLSFAMSSIIGLVVVGFNRDTFSMMTDIAVASVFYISVPQNIENKLFNMFIKQNEKNYSAKGLYNNINISQQSLCDIRSRLEQISNTLENSTHHFSVSNCVKKGICNNCEKYSACWQKNARYTTKKIVELESQIKMQNPIYTEKLSFCINSQRLCDELKSALNTYVCEVSTREKNSLMRNLLIEQLSSTEELLRDLENNAQEIFKVDEKLSEICERVFEKYSLSLESINVYVQKNSEKSVVAYFKKLPEVDMIKITVELGQVLGCELEMPVQNKIGNLVRLSFCEYSHYKITSAMVQISCKNQEYCGDTIERVWLSSNKYMVIVSDGMSTGKRARLDSSFATSILSKLVLSGVSPETSLKMLNSIMRVKGWDESFATIDIAMIDLCVGEVEFIKCGASPSFIIRDGNLIKIEGEAFPIGILPKVSPYFAKYKLFENDRIVLTTDGVYENCVKKACVEIFKNNLNSKQSAEIISEYSKEIQKDNNFDDISVFVTEVSER